MKMPDPQKDGGLLDIFGRNNLPTLQEETEMRAQRLQNPFGRLPAEDYGWSEEEEEHEAPHTPKEPTMIPEQAEAAPLDPQTPIPDLMAPITGTASMPLVYVAHLYQTDWLGYMAYFHTEAVKALVQRFLAEQARR